MNNDLLDTYQLKSLDGLAEIPLDKIAITQLKEQGWSRSGAKKKVNKPKFCVTLKKYLQHQEEKNGSDARRAETLEYQLDNFSMRKPYDRVISCLGFRFNFSIFQRWRTTINLEC